MDTEVDRIATQLTEVRIAGREDGAPNVAAVAATLTECDEESECAQLRGADGQVIVVSADGLRIGRMPDNHLVVANPKASRHHAVIVGTPDGFILRDLGSANGTYVGDTKVVESHLLREGDEIRICDQSWIFERFESPARLRTVSSVSTALAMAMIGNDYRYLGELGSGGGGTVVLARHEPMNRMVAVKAVTASSRSALARLRREGRVLAALDHPSILNIFRLVEDGTVLALITEYLEGGNFEDALEEQRLAGRAVVDVLVQVGSALQVAHAAGVVHRDVKPTNVLLGREDRVVLADFGLSRLGGEFRTPSGAITGIPMYMAPEQITAPDVEAPTVDVYPYGALTYRALTGRPPFVASDLKTLADMHLRAAPSPLDQVGPGVPRAVSKVVLAMLAKNPKDRPALPHVAAALTRVQPDVWDAVLPESRETAVRKTSLPGVAATGTVGGGTEGGSETGSAPDVPVVPTVNPQLLASVEQPVFRPKRTHRRRNHALVVAGSVLVGLAVGLVVLLLV